MSKQYIFGYKMALVLVDERGEFEVDKAFKFDGERGVGLLDVSRVLDAIDKREMRGRPVL